MKIVTRSAQEMAMQVPKEVDLAAVKYCIPNPTQFPLPTPAEVNAAYHDFLLSTDYQRFLNIGQKISEGTVSLLTGIKKKGSGYAIASYPNIYNKAIVHLQELWKVKDDPSAIEQYLLNNPIYYRPSASPDLARQEDGSINIRIWVANCISNLMDYIYLSSEPSYQYIREALLEKARALRKGYAEKVRASGSWTNVYVHPQRLYTSHNLGEDETALGAINAGYRVSYLEDPYTGESLPVVELVTWFFTDSKTKSKVFKDWIDVENNDVEKAIREMKRSPLYLRWAREMSPREYANACSPYEVSSVDINTELQGLTILRGNVRPD